MNAPPILISSAIEPSVRKRVFYIDALRSFANLLVVASHVFAPICAGMNDYSRTDWWIFNVADSLIRPCAALFVMISGKLILGSSREEPYLHFVRRRCLKLFIPFFVWSVIYVYVESILQNRAFSLGHAVVEFFKGPTEYHLWFMYMILSIYLVAPFLRQFVRAIKLHELSYVLVLWFIFLTIQFVFPERMGFGPAITVLNYGGFFLLGYYLDRSRVFEGKTALIAAVGLTLIGINAWATYLLTLRGHGVLDEKFYGGDTPLQAIYSGAFFLVFKGLPFDDLLERWEGLRRFVTSLSLETYNVYLVHPFFIWLLARGTLGLTLTADTGAHPTWGVTITTLVVLACSLGFALVAKKLPIVSRLLVTGVTNRSTKRA